MGLTLHRCTDTQNGWHIDKQMDTKKKKKIQNTNTVVDAGPPDTEYLYYPLDVKGVTVKGSLLPASVR